MSCACADYLKGFPTRNGQGGRVKRPTRTRDPSTTRDKGYTLHAYTRDPTQGGGAYSIDPIVPVYYYWYCVS